MRQFAAGNKLALLEELNAQQRAAVEAPDGPVMIVAGPGTGKTKTLTTRFVWLLEQGVPKSEVLALTFTNKAAAQMRTRVDELLRQIDGQRAHDRDLPVMTFHALGSHLLGESERVLVGNEERLEIVRALRRPTELKGVSVRELGLGLSVAKNMIVLPDGAWGELVDNYNAALRERWKRDFDDLLRDTYEQVLAAPKNTRRRYVLVDEFQDTNEIQYELAKLLVGAGGLFVIGDPRQSIYGFRGARGRVFEQYASDFPETVRIDLTVNYRSSRKVVEVGNAVFSDGPKLSPASRAMGQVRVLETLGEYSEAAWVIGEIESGVGGTSMQHAHDSGSGLASFRDYTVLYRTHRSAVAFIRRLADCGLPYQVAGEGSPYERPAMQRLMEVVQKLGGDIRVVHPELALVAEQLRPQVGQISAAELVREVARRLGGFELEADAGELTQLQSIVVRFGSDVSALAKYFADLGESEYYDPMAEVITLSTIHAAKGLEFEHVFVIGAEEGLVPYARNGAVADLEEERRLFYVATTRAKSSLDFIFTRERGGQKVVRSRFFDGLPVQYTTDPLLPKLIRKRTQRQAIRAQGTLF